MKTWHSIDREEYDNWFWELFLREGIGMSVSSNRIEEIRQLVAAFDRAAADVALMKTLPRVTGAQTLEWKSWNTNDPVIDRSTLERIVNAGIAALTMRASAEIDELSVKLNAVIPDDAETKSE